MVATGKHSESNEQIAVIDWVQLQHPWLREYTIHIGNERKSSYYAGYIMKRMGVLRGASDLFFAIPCEDYHGLFVEMKSMKGRATPEQLAFIDRMNRIGYFACVRHGAEEAISTIDWYVKLPRRELHRSGHQTQDVQILPLAQV